MVAGMSAAVIASTRFLIRLLRGAMPVENADSRLNRLFERLARTDDSLLAGEIEREIWEIWSAPSRPGARILMREGVAAIGQGRTNRALDCFAALVRAAPDYAEAWNKRATLRYLNGDLLGAIADSQRAIAIEPRHFGAMAGLGQIFLQLGDREAALEAFDAALAIHPHLDAIRASANYLRAQGVGGAK